MCVCRSGFYYPDPQRPRGVFEGADIEREYSKLTRSDPNEYLGERFRCRPCGEGCDTCMDGEPCVVQLDWTMRTALLVITITVIGFLPVVVWFVLKYQHTKVLKAASPLLLIIILGGAFLLYGPVWESLASNLNCYFILFFMMVLISRHHVYQEKAQNSMRLFDIHT